MPMDVTKYDISTNKSIRVTCPECGKMRQLNIVNLPRIGRAYKVKCKCNNHFLIIFERRKYIRKKVNFIGIYYTHSRFRSNIIDITDLSKGGCTFIRKDKHQLKIGDTISIRFNLDNVHNDVIDSTALIKNIFDNRVCIEFLVMRGSMERTLGFYFI